MLRQKKTVLTGIVVLLLQLVTVTGYTADKGHKDKLPINDLQRCICRK